MSAKLPRVVIDLTAENSDDDCPPTKSSKFSTISTPSAVKLIDLTEKWKMQGPCFGIVAKDSLKENSSTDPVQSRPLDSALHEMPPPSLNIVPVQRVNGAPCRSSVKRPFTSIAEAVPKQPSSTAHRETSSMSLLRAGTTVEYENGKHAPSIRTKVSIKLEPNIQEPAVVNKTMLATSVCNHVDPESVKSKFQKSAVRIAVGSNQKTFASSHVSTISFSHAADALRTMLMAEFLIDLPRVSSKVLTPAPVARGLGRLFIEEESLSVDVTDKYIQNMEAYIRRAIQNDDPADCSARICLFKQLDLLMSGKRFHRLPSFKFLLHSITSSDSNETSIAVFVYLYKNCAGKWIKCPAPLEILMYFDAMQSALAKIRSFGQLNARCANQFSFLCACEDFMDVIMELTTDLRLTLSAEILNPLISKLVDTIKFHVKNNATVNPKEAIMYKKTMGIFSHRLIQKSLDVINILFDHSKRTEPSFDIWAVHLASNGFTPLDSIYFLKFYCLGAPLRISMESAAVQVWDKNYLITHDL